MQNVTLKEKAYLELKQRIINGELRPGEILTERVLVESLGMSRTPIRAALERLDAEGLAKYTPNKGLVVTEIPWNRASDFYDFRAAIESYVVRKLACRIWSDEEKEWFEINLREQEACVERDDYHGFTRLDFAFHRKLAQIYDNADIEQTIDQLQDKLYQIALKVLQKDRARIRVSCADHADIYRLIVAGEADTAAAAMERHLEYGKRILMG